MKKSDILTAFIAGIVIGLFALPVASNIGVLQKIHNGTLYLVLGAPLLSLVSIFIGGLVGRFIPIIWQFAKFGLIGVMNTAIDFGILNILIFATGYNKGLVLSLFNIISFTFAVINSYFWNKYWVFHADEAGGKSFVEFIIVSVVAVVVSSLIIGGMTAYIPAPHGISGEQWANIAKLLAVAASLLINFFGYKFLVFKKSQMPQR